MLLNEGLNNLCRAVGGGAARIKKKITSYQAYSLLGYYVENKDNFKLNVNFILQMYPNVAKTR